MLILISGLPGSGKTTLARAFSAQINALHLNSDLIRRALGLLGHYASGDKAAVYVTLQERARASLLQGKDVVIDSTFYKESVRGLFRQLAAHCGAALCWVEVRAQEAVIRERLKTPRPDSEADFAVYEKIRDEAEPLPDPHLLLWSDAETLENMVAATKQYIEKCRPQ
ncbi:MAG: AAA family ATPase [Bacteroidota bacterium]